MEIDSMSSETTGQERPLPNPFSCCAKVLGKGGPIECVVFNPSRCAHALQMGVRFLCRHPEGGLIATRSKDGGRKNAGANFG
jgi:hypothetical protein